MRQSILMMLSAATIGLAGCEQSGEEQVQDALADLNMADEMNLNEIMLTVGDPNQAVAYFAAASQEEPERIDMKRGLAMSLVRAQRPADAIGAWQEVVAHEESTNEDKISLADAYVRNNDWDTAAATLNTVPPTYETFRRYRLEAMVADSRQQWDKADSFYETAVGLTTRPASVYNNWGYSKLSRGDYGAAERLFMDALRLDSSLFTAKNNLILARGAQRKYTMPLIPMSQIERAQLLHTLALAAIKQNDVTTGKALLRDAIETHPQFFEEAQRSLDALEA
ncbi:MAG: tetratricopeptide repeat protein [Yoonia sp.]|uniref:tetratricopeptide repeat protein n=1 Tax=Yoonia sp. TaxID=2212373 RepID=UPI003EF1C27B